MSTPFKKIIVLNGLIGLSLFGILAASPPEQENPVYKNLQVLSKKISDRNMDFVMESFNNQLGVTCIFCHLATKDGYRFTIDYVTDKLENKRIAREMLRMTMKLNKKYFNTKLSTTMTTRARIWCATCHQGIPVPILPLPKSK